MKNTVVKMAVTLVMVIQVMVSVVFGQMPQRHDYKAWAKLSDNQLIDSLKTEVPPFDLKNVGPLTSFAYKSKGGTQVRADKAQSHFKEYLEYFKKLNLYGVDPYELYYKKIDITKLEEFKKAGFDLQRIWAYNYITELDNPINYLIVKNPVILIGTLKKGTKNIYEYLEVQEVLKDNYNYFKKGDIVNSSIDVDDPTIVESKKRLAEFMRVEFDPSDVFALGDKVVIYINKYDIDKRYMKNKKNIDENFDLNYTISLDKIKSADIFYEKNLKDFIEKVKLFEKINNQSNFYNIKFK